MLEQSNIAIVVNISRIHQLAPRSEHVLLDAAGMDQEMKSYNVPFDHPDYEEANNQESNEQLINRTMLFPNRKIYLCTLCPKRVVNIFVLINHVTRHARGQIQCDPDYEDPTSMLTNNVLVNKILLNNPFAAMYQCDLCPKKVVNLDVFIQHRHMHGKAAECKFSS